MSARKLAVYAALALLGMANLVLLAGFNYNNSTDQGLQPSAVFSAKDGATHDDSMYEELFQPVALPGLLQEKALPLPQGEGSTCKL